MNALKILLAEDDENLGSLLKEYLIAKKYDTDWYPNGEEAYKNFVKRHYDILLRRYVSGGLPLRRSYFQGSNRPWF